MWDNILFGLAIVIIVFLVVVFFKILQLEKKSTVSTELMMWMQDVSGRLDKNSFQIDRKLSDSMSTFNTRLDKAAEVIGTVQKSIGEFSEIGRSMKQLQEFLQSPKLRGNFGEQVLRELLVQSLPGECFALQYTFQTGEKVDAVVKTSQGMIPIDSKFPIDNFRKLMEAETDALRLPIRKEFERDVKKHILDIARKYIRPDEGTTDYALMYIPSEAIYYEIINNPALYDFSYAKRILLVSPMSFYAYLKAILISFEGQQIQTQARKVVAILQSLRKDYEKTDESIALLNKHITNAYNQTNITSKVFNSLGQKIESASSFTLSAEKADKSEPNLFSQ